MRKLVVSLLLLLCAGCDMVSRDQVQSAVSADGKLEAVVIETNGWATTSFGYEIGIRAKSGGRIRVVASIYGAARNADAYGVNLRWEGGRVLNGEYLEAKRVVSAQSSVDIDGTSVRIVLRDGVEDPTAPSGGMLHNLEKS